MAETDTYLVYPSPHDPRLTERVSGTDQNGDVVEASVTVERPISLFLNNREVVTLMTIADYGELEDMRSQPDDVYVQDITEHMADQGFEGDLVPASAWMDWNIYQPARYHLIDFSDSNGHQDLPNGKNGAYDMNNYSGTGGVNIAQIPFTVTNDYWPDDSEFTTVPVDISCTHRASEVILEGQGTSSMIASTMTVTKISSGNEVASFENCEGASAVELEAGDYSIAFDVRTNAPLAANDSVMVETPTQFVLSNLFYCMVKMQEMD